MVIIRRKVEQLKHSHSATCNAANLKKNSTFNQIPSSINPSVSSLTEFKMGYEEFSTAMTNRSLRTIKAVRLSPIRLNPPS